MKTSASITLRKSKSGKNGYSPRPRGWFVEGDNYAWNDDFRDIVLHGERPNTGTYMVRKYGQVVTIAPTGSSSDKNWIKADQFKFVASELALLRQIQAEEIDVDNLIVKTLVTADGKTIIKDGQVRVDGEIIGRLGRFGYLKISGSCIVNEGNDGWIKLHDSDNDIGVMLGTNTLPGTAGFGIPMRITNNQYNYGVVNTGIKIDVSNPASYNIGVDSNAALRAPAFITNKKKTLTPSDLSMPLSQFNIFALKLSTYTALSLPTESQVRSMFGYNSLLSDFACQFTIYIDHGSSDVRLNNIYNENYDKINLDMAKGDSVTLLCTKNSSIGFHYKEISRWR